MKWSFKAIALVGKYQTPEIAGPLFELAEFLEKRKIKVFIDELTASQVGAGRYAALPLDILLALLERLGNDG